MKSSETFKKLTNFLKAFKSFKIYFGFQLEVQKYFPYYNFQLYFEALRAFVKTRVKFYGYVSFLIEEFSNNQNFSDRRISFKSIHYLHLNCKLTFANFTVIVHHLIPQ